MSEQGWHDFHGAEGVDDWVVLHGGATAVFRVRSVGEAARLAEAVANVPGLEGSGVLLTMVDASLTVRLSRDLWARGWSQRMFTPSMAQRSSTFCSLKVH